MLERLGVFHAETLGCQIRPRRYPGCFLGVVVVVGIVLLLLSATW